MDFGIIDFYDDLTNTYLSPFLKVADLPSKDKSKLKDSDFALIIRDSHGNVQRYYPIATEIDTQLSLDYFAKTGHKLPPRARQVAAYYLKKYAETFGLPVPKYIENVLEGITVVASNVVDLSEVPEEETEEVDYLLPDAKLFPVKSDKDLQKYIQRYSEIFKNLDEDQKKEFSFNLVRLSSVYKIPDLPKEIYEYARKYSDKKISERLSEIETEKEAYLKQSAKSKEVWENLTPEQRFRLAKMLKEAQMKKPFVSPAIADAYTNFDITPYTALNLQKRYEMLKHYQFNLEKYAEMRDEIQSIAEGLRIARATKQTTTELLLKFAHILKKFDEKYGLDKYYGKEIDDYYITFSKYPMVVSVFSKSKVDMLDSLEKIAEERSMVPILEMPQVLAMEKLSSLPIGVYRKFFREPLATQLKMEPLLMIKIATTIDHPYFPLISRFFRIIKSML
ncbi:MAG: hypothetical protein QXG39_10170 [Candidatus Aenigmatarchaeota archaeon]